MKKLTRKLLLSVFTLAICAVTLVSTTFAWYTTNTEATTNTVQGQTNAATDSSNLLISSDGNVWSSVCTPNIGSTGTAMIPLQYNGNALIPLSGSIDDSKTQYIQFKLWFKTNKTATAANDQIVVYLTHVNVKNAKVYASDADKLTTVDNLLFNGNNTPQYAPSTEKYAVDIVRALNLVSVSNETTVTKNHLDLTNVAQVQSNLETGIRTSVSAEEYYEDVMDAPIQNQITPYATPIYNANVEGYTSGNAISVGKIVSSTVDSVTSYSVLEVTFTVYLDGWDQYCFDACRGQQFNLDLGFSIDVADALHEGNLSA